MTKFAVVTVSDTRTPEDDFSGEYLKTSLISVGHIFQTKEIVKDVVADIRAVVNRLLTIADLEVIVLTGGTGLSRRDVSIEALEPFFFKAIPGFGELFRHLSFSKIGNLTINSRASAGITDKGVLIFLLPGSINACKDAWNDIIKDQIDQNSSKCNLIKLCKSYRLN